MPSDWTSDSVNPYSTDIQSSLLGDYSSAKKRNDRPARCCGCCCACEEGWYCGTGWRVANNVIWLIATILALLAIALCFPLWPTPANVDFELLPGDQALFCPRTSVFGETTHFSSREVNCSATVTLFKGDLRTLYSDKHKSHIVVPKTWVSANEHISRSFYLNPGSTLSWKADVANAVMVSADNDEKKPTYALFKSRKAYESYRKSGEYAQKKSTEEFGVIPTQDSVTYTVNEMDEYVLVLEARANSAFLSADVIVERTRYDSAAQKDANETKTDGDGVSVSLSGRCALLENKWTNSSDDCSVVVGVRYDVNDVTSTIVILSILFGIIFIHIISVIVICCCAYCQERKRRAAKPDMFKTSFDPVPYGDDD